MQNIIEDLKKYQSSPKKATKRRKYRSMKNFLGMPNLLHEDSVQSGQEFERILKHLVELNHDCQLLDTLPSLKKVEQKDLLFYNKNENTVYYFEVKTNTNIDGEKRKATAAKINNITPNNFEKDQKYLKEKYNIFLSSDDQIVSCVLCPTKLDEETEWLTTNTPIWGLPMFLSILNSKEYSQNIEQITSIIREKIKSRLNLI